MTINKEAGMGRYLFVAVWVSGGLGLLVWWLCERSKEKKKEE